VVVLVVIGAGWYAWHLATRQAAPPPLPSIPNAVGPTGPRVVFTRQAGDRDTDGALGVAPLDQLDAAGFDVRLRCIRVHMAAGTGVCLEEQNRFPVRYAAVLLDPQYRRVGEVPLVGLPSRVQLSRAGRYAGVTVFVSGHSYLESGFSTRTSILDVGARRWAIDDLETIAVYRDGQPFRQLDFNFWGVTFAADEDTFYATLSTGRELFLIKGTVTGRRAEIVDTGVECPSLSPDNRRIAFKHRVTDAFGSVTWRLQVLDLASGRRVSLAEDRHVDDQVQWLDDEQVLYAVRGASVGSMDTWVASADGTGPPRLFLEKAYSTSVTRPVPGT
jgi:hypothetical protein